ncbi:MAG: lipopolysaccharide heptosyltransferase II [Alphaproteobacteria bacterium]
MAKTLLVSLQGIGNAILSLPLAEALHHVGDEVTLLTLSPRLRPILTRPPMVDAAIFAGEPNYHGLAGKLRLVSELRRRRFDRAVFSFPSGQNSYRLAQLAGINKRIGHRYPELGRGERLLTRVLEPVRMGHDLDQNLQTARELGLAHDAAELWPPLPVPEELAEQGRQYLADAGLDPAARYLGLHTGCDGQWVEKRWPEKHFAQVAEKIYEKYGWPALVFDGPAEPGTGQKVARLACTPVHALNGWGDLADAWGLLAACAVFVSNDSGLMNFAAAAGLPTVAVFGPSQPHRTRPYGPRGRAVITDRTCAPCFTLRRYPGCPYEYHHCMADLAPARVLAAVEELVSP